MNVHSQTRTNILQAALELFSARGFHGTAVPEVARAAGVAAGTIYRHFASKEELVNALYREHKAALMSALLEGFPVAAAPRDQFSAIWGRLANFARSEPLAFAFLELHHHAPYLDEQSRRLERDALAPIAALVGRAAARGAALVMPAPVAMALVWGAFVGLVKAGRLGYLELTDAVIAQAEDACWNAISKKGPS